MTVRTHYFAKLFFLVTFAGLLMYIVLVFYSFHTEFFNMWKNVGTLPEALRQTVHFDKNRFAKDLKYILMWNFNKTSNTNGDGQEPFITANCKYINCYVTRNKYLLSDDYTNFEAIVFHSFMANSKLRPKRRKLAQKYVFFNQLPSEEHPVCNVHADGYFNWTWSYKLYSDILSPFIEVRHKKYDLYVAPNRIVDWVSDKYSKKVDAKPFEGKKKAVAWYAQKCHTRNNRMKAVMELSDQLVSHKMIVDVFGKCGKPCPNRTLEGCKELFRKEYYFVLAYEDSFSEDFVTKEVLIAYDSLAVPIVWGKSDYKKFLPVGSYINTEELSTVELAAKIVYTIRNLDIYLSYFRWREHYVIREYNANKAACTLCELLNSDEATRYSSYDNLRAWWYSMGSLRERCLPYNFENEYDLEAKKRGLINISRPVGEDNVGDVYGIGNWLDNSES